MNLLTNPAIGAEISRAWQESQADEPAGRHEEGGFIVLMPDLTYRVERWQRGRQSRINPPSFDADNRYNGNKVIAAFHTHPNPPIDEAGREWEQSPSETDRRWHLRRKLRGIVISRTLVYEVDENGNVSILGSRDEVLLP